MGSDQKLRGSDRRLLLLDEADNVLVAISRIKRGETIALEGASIALSADLPIGHKLARRAIAAGEKIIKYGAPIGSATAEIAKGAHVRYLLFTHVIPPLPLDALDGPFMDADPDGRPERP